MTECCTSMGGCFSVLQVFGEGCCLPHSASCWRSACAVRVCPSSLGRESLSEKEMDYDEHQHHRPDRGSGAANENEIRCRLLLAHDTDERVHPFPSRQRAVRGRSRRSWFLPRCHRLAL